MEEFLRKVITAIRTFFRQRLHYQAEDLPYYITILIAALLFILGLNAFVELTEELAEDNLSRFDDTVTKTVLSFRSDQLTRVLVFITNVGTSTGYIIIVAGLTLYFWFRLRSWKFIVQTVVTLVLASISNIMLKQLFSRERPTIEHLVSVHSLSYPSGHAMSAMGFYGFLIFLILRYTMNRELKVLFISLLTLLILAIGLSRVYLGVHYPSDVLAGFIGGIIWVTFCAIVFDVIDLFRRRKNRILQRRDLGHTDFEIDSTK
jgi:membrane-associated phospholipid phosphatase